MSDTYVLGSAEDELDRLGLQHQVWHASTTRLWERAGFGPDQSLLDAGCGPGFATVDLANLVGRDGHVTAIDSAPVFIASARARIAALGLERVDLLEGDLLDVPLAAEHFDGVFLRWVLSFVAEPAAVVNRLAATLRPGGALLAIDYANYRAARIFPHSTTLDSLFEHFAEANRRSGGDYNRGARLPYWLQRCGLNIELFEPMVFAARPGDRYWFWFIAFCRVFVPALVASGEVDSAFATRVFAELRERERDPAAFFLTPPVLAVIARRPQPPRSGRGL